jgi:release factor glutamine methyltransferase
MTNIKTKAFHYNNLIIELDPHVYEPAEDTFLILENLTITPQDRILEIGTGCGIIALECARQGADVLCTDINPYAVKLVNNNFVNNQKLIKGRFEVRAGDLFKNILKNEVFDIIIFNPPYLPTTEQDHIEQWFDMATNGGKDGLKVINRFLNQMKSYLSEKAKTYFIISSLANQKKVEQQLKQLMIQFEIIARYQYHDETIFLYLGTPKT